MLPKRDTYIDEPAREPTYRIHLNIGFGVFSTVWLWFDLEKRLVDWRVPGYLGISPGAWPVETVRIKRNLFLCIPSTEAQILRSMRETQTGTLISPGSENVASLYDIFVVCGSNAWGPLY